MNAATPQPTDAQSFYTPRTDEFTPYADPAKQPHEYFGQMWDAWHEAEANLAEGFVYAATSLLSSCWHDQEPRTVVYAREERYSTRLNFVRIEDAEGNIIATADSLPDVIGDDDEHPALIGVQHLAAAYSHWQAGATRQDERAWKAISSSENPEDGSPHYVTYTLPHLAPDDREPRRDGLIRRVRVGAAEARTYDMGSHMAEGRRWIGHYRNTLTSDGITASIEYNELEPGVHRVTIDGDPETMRLTINGMPTSARRQPTHTGRQPHPGESPEQRATRLNREALAYNYDDAGPTVEYPGARIHIFATPAGGLGINVWTEDAATDPGLATSDDLSPDMPVEYYRDDTLRLLDDPAARTARQTES